MTQLGQYTLLEDLGGGVLSTVYKARHGVTGAVIALKTLRLDVLDDVGSREMDSRLRTCFEAVSHLIHPGIASVFEMRREEGFALIATELVDGPGITAFLQRGGEPDVTGAVVATVQLLEALEFAHSRSVVHRNLKPSNILVSQGARIKIVDFGMVDLAARNRTDTGLLVGKMEYMAPEQFRGSSIDDRCDIHAAGVLLYELLTGVSPFADANGFAMPKVLELTPTAPSRVNPGVSQAFDAVVARALAKSPTDRFSTAARFRSELCAAHSAAFGRPPPQFLASSSPERRAHATEAPAAVAPPVKTTVIIRRPTAWSTAPGSGEQKTTDATTPVPTEVMVAPFPQAPPPEVRQAPEVPLPPPGEVQRVASKRTVPLSEASIALGGRVLARFVGPIAIVLSRRAATDTHDEGEYFEALATHLKDPKERTQFFREVGRRG